MASGQVVERVLFLTEESKHRKKHNITILFPIDTNTDLYIYLSITFFINDTIVMKKYIRMYYFKTISI